MKIDMVIDLQAGDCGKGKVAHYLIGKNKYTHVCRASGGPNAGHTIYHEGKKYITHHIPSGVFYAIPSVIGGGCVVNPKTLLEEVEGLEKAGFPVSRMLKVSYNTHIITPEHVEEDIRTDKIGSTKRGIMPVYRDKYARIGKRAEDVPEIREFVCDPYYELHDPSARILIEGAQGTLLCPDWGDYPYVTSSSPSSTFALHSLGLPPQKVRTINATIKPYLTYVGSKEFEPKNSPDKELFEKIREVGKEYGATTGRPRQVNWMDLNQMVRAAKMNGITDLVVNKMDVMREIGIYKWYRNERLHYTKQEELFKNEIVASLPRDIDILFSYSPEEV